jgi:hypothetical protein
MLLVSAWARRAVFLWAFLPAVVISMFEKMAFRTDFFGSLLRERMIGTFQEAFVREVREGRAHISMRPLTQLAPGEFLARPGLWVGLAVAAGFRDVKLHVQRMRVRLPSPNDFVLAHLAATPVASDARAMSKPAREALGHDVARQLSAYEEGDGIAFPEEVNVVTANA